jgi:hypothetical protein
MGSKRFATATKTASRIGCGRNASALDRSRVAGKPINFQRGTASGTRIAEESAVGFQLQTPT